ncbi:MAG: endopeptidase La [Chloroflexi bacterium]|nr:endopeptidase La [Chloroflexota bacterium]
MVAPDESRRAEIAEVLHTLPAVVPILPLRGTVVYPYAVVPLSVGQERSKHLIDDAMRGDRLLGVVPQLRPEIEGAGPEDVYRLGTVCRILQLLRKPDGTLTVALEGLERMRVAEWTGSEPYVQAHITLAPDEEELTPEVEALKRSVLARFRQVVDLSGTIPEEAAALVAGVEDPRQVLYLVAGNLRLDVARHQAFYGLPSLIEKLRWLDDALAHEVEVLEVSRRIAAETKEHLTRAQREYILREQLRTIQRELGEESPEAAEVAELRHRLDQADPPPEARQEAERELARLAQIPAASPERGIIRTYLEWLVSLPWRRFSGGSIDVVAARRVLDEDHYDLEKIKDRIVEYLAVRKFKQERAAAPPGQEAAAPQDERELHREPILCFVGPPGVGKTSLGQSIARAMGRKFLRISLGGMRDEAEIRGHRRTYIGALPGRIIQGMRRVGVSDPVFMLDEVDKLAVSFQGDPAAALLEVLDPAQNASFTDHYLGVPFDLSSVLFVCTANTMDTIPAPLLDRMEVLRLAGYTEEEKRHIARRYLLPRQLHAHGLRPEELSLDDAAVRTTIRGYTREAGVRTLERQIATICRKAVRELAEGATPPVPVTAERVAHYLGRPQYQSEVAERTERPGVAIGLAWTPFGGDVLFVEATMMSGREERLILTGMLGEVMRESALAALSYVRSNAALLGVDPAIFEDKVVHIHVPAGAVPKDGPSAGVTIATALASLVTGRPARSDVGMTGEITLRGVVLPVGGIKEKVLAAHRAGLRTVALPRRNEPDLEDIPAEVRAALQVVLVDTVDAVLATALGEPRAVPAPATVTGPPGAVAALPPLRVQRSSAS